MKKRLIAVLLALLLMMPTYAVANADTIFEITRQPGNIEAPIGTTGFTTVEARAEGEVTYRWYYWNADDEEWVDTGKLDEDGNLVREWEGFDADTIYVPVTENSVGQQFFCLLTNENGNTLSSDIVTVGEGLTSEIKIDAQPEDIWAKNGAVGTAFVEVSIESEPIVEITYTYPEVPVADDTEPAAEMVPDENYEEPEKNQGTEPTEGDGETYDDTDEGEPVDEEAPIDETPVEPIPHETLIERNADVTYKWLYLDTATGKWQAAAYEGSDSDVIRIPVTAENDGQQLVCLIRTADGGKAESDVITVHLTGTPEPEEPAESEKPTEPEANTDPEEQGDPEEPIDLVDPEEETEPKPEEIQEPSEITIVTQPADIIAAIGQTGTATVEATSEATLSYQWYYKTKGTNVWKPSGFTGCTTDTISVPVTAARIGQQYKCVITSDDGGEIETDAVTVYERIPTEVTIVTQPTDIKVRVGETGTATVEATSDAELSYRWYFKSVSRDYWEASGFEGCTTATISVPVTKARIGQQYKCVITTDDGNSIESDIITVLEPNPSVITILTQPTDIQGKLGQNGTATVEAFSDASLSYQWYFKAKGSEVWQASGFVGAKTATISVPVETKRVGQQYKCVIKTDDGATIESDVVTVLNPIPSEIVIEAQPTDIQEKLDVIGTATVEASTDTGAALSYQWYFKAKNSNTWQASGFTGSKTNTISVPVATSRVGQQYKCVITTADGGKAETNAVTVIALPSEVTIDTQPEDMYGAVGDSATATVKASADTSATLCYQWYFKAAGSEEWKASGMTGNRTATIAVPVTAARIGQQYKCVITTADGGSAETEAVTICDNSAYAFTITNPDSYGAYEGIPVDLAVSTSLGTGVHFQWYKNGEMIEGATDSHLYYSAVTLEDAGEYYCVATAFGHTEISGVAVVVVDGR